jgi:cytochrome c556
MIRYLTVATLIAVGATVAYATGPTGTAAIAERKAAMKAVAGASKAVNDMNKGDVPFDAAKAKAAFATMEQSFTKSKTLFPADSKTGGETAAQPAVWEKSADFMGKFDAAIATVKAAGAASTTEAAFKDQVKNVGATCGGCHKDYRAAPAKK